MNPFWTVSLFWIATVACVAIALAFVLPALLRTRSGIGKAARRDVNIAVYRDQLKELEADRSSGLLSDTQFEAAKQELEMRLADDALSADDTLEPGRTSTRKLGYALGVVLPVAAFGLYFWLGNPMSLIAIANAQSNSPHPDMSAMAASQEEHDFARMIERVEEKTRTNPEDGNAWVLLAKSYAATEQWAKALPAYEKAYKMVPQDPTVLSGYAEALAISNNRVLTEEHMQLIRKALAIDPDDIKGVELAGIYAFQNRDFAQASKYFKRLYGLLPPDSAYAQDILAAQKKADSLLAEGGGTVASASIAPPPPAEKEAAAPKGASISGRVDIDPGLKSRLASTDVLFVFARTGQGGPPVAVLRTSANQLPLQFELNDTMAMNPDNTLSQQKQVMLVARISKSGSPMAQSGDLEGSVSDVKVGVSGVKILIDHAKP